ncbi:unnamed protein product [Ceutorhynchus assimilis]|uniref:Lipase domain-containing protein n=1 Tax=Ceutorhynchus assimilis TaxID=467358 RepID=A0A9N9QCZ5_9CUCU|nr:unnamed protein product [Ceutorhynchus assimilis]
MKYLYCLHFSLAFICLVRGQVKIDPVSFIYYSKHLRLDPPESDFLKVFNPLLPTVVLVHGWAEDFKTDSNKFIREAILSKFDANIITVDWSKFAKEDYVTARVAVPFVGKQAAALLDHISKEFAYSLGRVTMVGYSLGAQVCGAIGKNLHGRIGVLTALDPPSFLFAPYNRDDSIHKTDAQYVQVIHTTNKLYGMSGAVGHSDFYPNGGERQPGCDDDEDHEKCSHRMAWKYFVESINKNTFLATRCDSWNDFKDGSCHGERRLMGGLQTVEFAKGKFYLRTNSDPPYGKH